MVLHHIEETNWDDNHSPDFGDVEKSNNWYQRITYLLKKMK